MNEEDKKDVKSLLEKVSALRKEILTENWEDDKLYSAGGSKGFSYISADKAKRNLAPLFNKVGIELRMNFDDLQCRESIGMMSQHFTVRLNVSLIDIETGCELTSTVYGEAGDSGDKGVNKAQTCAIKQWIFSEFLVADGLDPDAEEAPVRSAFVKKTPEEAEAVKSKILANAVKPSAPAPAPVPKAKAAPPAPPVPQAPKAKAKEKAEPKIAPLCDFEINGPQKSAIDRIVASWQANFDNGVIDLTELEAMQRARGNISSDAEAVEFIRMYMEK